MSGIIGHAAYAILASKAAAARRLPVAPVIHGHFSSYLAGAYLGCDIQTLPAAVCVDSGEGVGYGVSPIERSPITGGAVRPWVLHFEGRDYSPREINEMFYGRSHLILGWTDKDRGIAIAISDYLDYAADVAGDAIELFGPGRRSLAFVLGWLTHVTGDGLIKSVIEGINLHLIDGKYTAVNRPVQDLVTFNEIGAGELGLDWAVLLDDLARMPVEAVQSHYMRSSNRVGRLGAHFEEGWEPERRGLLGAVLKENRRYQRVLNTRLVKQLTVTRSPTGEFACDPELSVVAGGLTYPEMLEAADKANFRHALWQMGEMIADVFARVIERQERLQDLPLSDGPGWEELTRKWRRAGK